MKELKEKLTIKKLLGARDNGFALTLVIVFIGVFFTMATTFYYFNLNQKPLVDLLDRSTATDYLVSGIAEIFKMKVKEFPEEFREAMIRTELEIKRGGRPWDNMQTVSASSDPPTNKKYYNFFHDFKFTSDSTWDTGAMKASDAYWHLFAAALFAANEQDNAAFKNALMEFVDKYNFMVDLESVQRIHIGLPESRAGGEFVTDLIQLTFDSKYKTSAGVVGKRKHNITFDFKRRFVN